MDVSVEIKNGVLELLTNGVFILNAHDATTLKIKVDNEELTLIIKFFNNDDPKAKKEAIVVNNTTLEIKFANYNSPIGNYTKDFWRIGQIKNRYLYWSYVISGWTDGNIKKIDYSFYLGEEVSHG